MGVNKTMTALLWRRKGCVETSEQLPVSEGGYKDAAEGLFIRDCSDRTRGDGLKLKQGKFRLDLRQKLFPVRVLRHWHRVPREAVAAPSLAEFKARLDRGAWSNLL